MKCYNFLCIHHHVGYNYNCNGHMSENIIDCETRKRYNRIVKCKSWECNSDAIGIPIECIATHLINERDKYYMRN